MYVGNRRSFARASCFLQLDVCQECADTIVAPKIVSSVDCICIDVEVLNLVSHDIPCLTKNSFILHVALLFCRLNVLTLRPETLQSLLFMHTKPTKHM
jgi:hypothetical protein